jgi:alanyl-tRNA synthetase
MRCDAMRTYCRFDFSFNRAAQTSELEQVESIVNSIIAAQLPVDSEVVPLQQAMAVAGLRAVFGEVYPDPVRVISVGPKVLYSTVLMEIG